MSIRVTFENQLGMLTDQLVYLSSMTDRALDKAMRALIEQDTALASEVVREDAEINRLRYRIEEHAYQLLATQQPMARDLRNIAASISIATNMERMADHASGIAILAHRMAHEPPLKPLVDIPRMGEIGREMLRDSIQAFLDRNEELAQEVAARDQLLNQLNEQVLRELLTHMVEGPSSIRRGTYLIWVSHNLERWGDRVKNICERVVYIVSGKLKDFDYDTLDEADVPADTRE